MEGDRRLAKVELLSPGGSLTGIKAAVAAGADAVYAGGSLFGARAYAENPDESGLLEAIDFCHLHRVRMYLTVNTLLKERELREELYAYIRPLYERGIDAVLVQDLGVFRALKEWFPDLPLHASTQMTITGADGAALLQQMGADRVVLSRELTLDDIRTIRSRTDVELETFVHGALCYCYSGQCLMSSLIGGRSGNRGRCAQPCRLPYSLREGFPGMENDAGAVSRERTAGKKPSGESGSRRMAAGTRSGRVCGNSPRRKDGCGRFNGDQENSRYLLSLKDICTLQILPDLIDAGISSLKIEGRMKRPQYAAGVTAIYRRYIDLYLERGREGYRIDPADMTALTDLYSRGGFSEGYYNQKNGPSMMTMDQPDHSGSAAARVLKADARCRLQALEDLYPSDVLRVEGKTVQCAEHVRAGQTFSLPGTYPGLREGSIVMRVRAQHLLDTLTETYVDRKLAVPAEGHLEIRAGKPLKAAAFALGREAVFCGSVVQEAEKHPLSVQDARRQFGKTGDTPFIFNKLDVELTGSCFLPVSDMNRARRQVLDRLKEEILSGSRRRLPEQADDRSLQNIQAEPGNRAEAGKWAGGAPEGSPSGMTDGAKEGMQREGTAVRHPAVTASVLTVDQLQAVLKVRSVGGVYVEASVFAGQPAPAPESITGVIHDAGKRAYLAMPYIWREDVRRTFEQALPAERMTLFDGILVRSIDQFGRLADWLPMKEVIADAGVYTWNTDAQKEVRMLGATLDTCPYECTAAELSARDMGGSELVVYGRQPLMVTAQCLRKNTGRCMHAASWLTLTDRMKAQFPVRCECAFCGNIIYNSVPLDLITAEKDRRFLSPASVRYSFTTETAAEVRKVLGGELPVSITRGHIRKGVE
ncbi:MAG: U32 family peptidase [Lachnospiraceae bacterium]|nr:U32 family peptidase [Lachnospiraceae bacterium]